MTLKTFHEVLSAIEGLEFVSIQGEGEPLLNHDFFEMIKIVKELHPEASISFITNGSLFSSQNIEQILSLGVKRIMVSIESANEEKFKEIRGGKLSKVERGIDALIKAREKMNLSAPVIGFATTLLRSTFIDFRDIMSLYFKLQMDGGIAVQPLQEMKSYYHVYDREMENQLMSHSDILEFWGNISADSVSTGLINRVNTESNFYSNLYSSSLENGCPWLSKGLYVNYAGVATGCCMIKDTFQYGFGRMNNENSKQIFAKRAMMQNQFLNGIIPEPCEGCQTANRIKKTYLENIGNPSS